MIASGVEIAAEHASAWNRRFAVRLADGAEVEAVLYRGDTLCISSQVGCAVRCPFCASGADGLARSLDASEMIAQVLAVEARGVALRGVTVSGIGEPLHNAARVADVIAWCHARGTPASLTTSGGPVARLGEYLREVPHRGLTISVHAGRDATRARLVPHGPALDPLFATLYSALPSLSRRRRKRTALAYLLLAGENDDPEELDAFAERARPLDLPVHLYAHNAVATSAMRGVGRAEYELAYARLAAHGLRVRMSSRARLEANGGCGTLVALRIDRERRDRTSTSTSTEEPRSRWPPS
jgi:23S rRNA (adenine2503-C2)-methyltransferase